jgi:multidrug resistance efflux pump
MYTQLQLELARAACRLKELEETVKTQRRALASMQQQLSAVSATSLFLSGLHVAGGGAT